MTDEPAVIKVVLSVAEALVELLDELSSGRAVLVHRDDPDGKVGEWQANWSLRNAAKIAPALALIEATAKKN